MRGRPVAGTFPVSQLPQAAIRAALLPPVVGAILSRLGLIHLQIPALEVTAVKILDRLLSILILGHFHETESARSASVPVYDQIDRDDLALRTKEFLKFSLSSFKREVTNVQFARHL